MRVRLAFVAPLLLIAGAVRAQTPEQQIPKELALALIPYGGTDGGEIIVGKLPPDLASIFTVPAGARVLGSFVSLTYGQAVIAIPGRADSAMSFARRTLTDHGWVPRERTAFRMGGLQYSPEMAQPTTYCKKDTANLPDAITIASQFHGPMTLLRLTRTAGTSICDPTLMSSGGVAAFGTGRGTAVGALSPRAEFVQSQMREMPLASVPPLYAPGDYRMSQRCFQQSDFPRGEETQTQPVRTELSQAEVLAHYGRQLDSAGWKPMSGAASTLSGTWSNATTGQEVTISIAPMHNAAGCYQVMLRATPRSSK